MRKEGCGLPAAEHSFRFKSPRTWITMYTCLHRTNSDTIFLLQYACYYANIFKI